MTAAKPVQVLRPQCRATPVCCGWTYRAHPIATQGARPAENRSGPPGPPRSHRVPWRDVCRRLPQAPIAKMAAKVGPKLCPQHQAVPKFCGEMYRVHPAGRTRAAQVWHRPHRATLQPSNCLPRHLRYPRLRPPRRAQSARHVCVEKPEDHSSRSTRAQSRNWGHPQNLISRPGKLKYTKKPHSRPENVIRSPLYPGPARLQAHLPPLRSATS